MASRSKPGVGFKSADRFLPSGGGGATAGCLRATMAEMSLVLSSRSLNRDKKVPIDTFDFVDCRRDWIWVI